MTIYSTRALSINTLQEDKVSWSLKVRSKKSHKLSELTKYTNQKAKPLYLSFNRVKGHLKEI